MGLNPIYCLRMILSENRCPLFGIMRWRELSPDTEGLATLLFHYPFAGGGLAQLALPVQQIEAGADDDGGPRHGPAVRHMVEHQIAEDHHPDELGIDERREHRRRGDPVAGGGALAFRLYPAHLGG